MSGTMSRMASLTSSRAFCGAVRVASWRIRWITSAARWPSITIAASASRALSRSGGVAASQLREAWASATRGGKPADEARLVPLEAPVEVRLVGLLEGLRAGELVDAHPDDRLGRQPPPPLE